MNNTLPAFLPLDNPVQRYAWGSPTAIPRLLGKDNPAGQPWAELWMGAHPKAPSTALLNERRLPLPDLIQAHPREILGDRTAQRFGPALPFLFKVLAAAKPLSIQAHPNLPQAQEGFARENSLNIPLDAPHRNYRDNNHKPEILCALTRFHALRGFRPLPGLRNLLNALGLAQAEPEFQLPANAPAGTVLRGFLVRLLTLTPDRRSTLVARTLHAASTRREVDPTTLDWVTKLGAEYPEDIGILAPIFLNCITLEPGEAIYLPAGELHAYLEGLGIELMANSDNVLRGGLTEKHVDVPELTKVLNFGECVVDILRPEAGPAPIHESRRNAACDAHGPHQDGRRQAMPVQEALSGAGAPPPRAPPQSGAPCAVERAYRTPTDEFALSVLELAAGQPFCSRSRHEVEILICTRGTARLTAATGKDSHPIAQGAVTLVPAATGAYRIEGDAVLYKATVPGE